MADITFPAYLEGVKFLGRVARAGYGYQPGELTLATDFELGTFQRQVYTDVPTRVQASWWFNSGQVAYFTAWWKYTLKAGVLPFNIDLQADGTYEAREVTMVGRYQIAETPAPDGYRVNAILEITQDTVMSEAAYDALNS